MPTKKLFLFILLGGFGLVSVAWLALVVGAPSFAPANTSNREATVVALVDARLTEIAHAAATTITSTNNAEATPSAAVVGTATAPSGDELLLITPTPDRSDEIEQYILARTRHFKGDEDAPVTIIEFSDFQ